MAKNRYKQVKKVFSISLGSRDRAFESPHSDQKTVIFYRKWLFFITFFSFSFLRRIVPIRLKFSYENVHFNTDFSIKKFR